jgi:hypothetical protein
MSRPIATWQMQLGDHREIPSRRFNNHVQRKAKKKRSENGSLEALVIIEIRSNKMSMDF